MRPSIIGGGPSAVGVGVEGHHVVSAVLAGCEDDIDKSSGVCEQFCHVLLTKKKLFSPGSASQLTAQN